MLVDGAPAYACTLRIADAVGHKVTTVEGLAQDGEPHPLQRAFLEEQAAQCGYCIPGMLMRAAALLERIRRRTKGPFAPRSSRSRAPAARTNRY